jgi:hypothetical protein
MASSSRSKANTPRVGKIPPLAWGIPTPAGLLIVGIGIVVTGFIVGSGLGLTAEAIAQVS